MCGIVGFNWYDEKLLRQMMAMVEHRGPEIRYLFFVERYLGKFYLTENQQLRNILTLQAAINEAKRMYEECFNKAKNGGGR